LNIYLDCIPCFIRQSLEAAQIATEDVQMHEQVVRDVLRLTAELDLSKPPPWVVQLIYRKLRELTGNDDPYQVIKVKFNKLVLNLLPEIKGIIKQSSEPLVTAAKFAIAANIIDLGVKSTLSETQISDALRESVDVFVFGDWLNFRKKVSTARRILYLADNAGEIAIDRLLIEEIGPGRVTLAVRGKPVINDATLIDAQEVGLRKLVEVIDNGSDAPGTILNDCSAEFRECFHEADLIISKGQGNFESLSEVDTNIFFLFKVKCPVIEKYIGLPLNKHVLLHSKDKQMKGRT
jgi:damage-control phosphatase, subfamily I